MAARLVTHVYMGPAFIGDPAIIRDPVFICMFDKKPRRLIETRRLMGTWLLLEVIRYGIYYVQENS